MSTTHDGPRSPNPLAPLLDAAEALVSSLDLEEALASMTAVIGEAMQVSKVDIYTYDRERDALIYEARWVGDDLDESIPRRNDPGTIIDVSARPSWRPILEGEIVEWHISDGDLPGEERQIYEEAGQKSTLDAPLTAGDQVIGVLGVVQRDRVRRFTPLERDLFGHLCRLAAVGIRNAQIVRRATVCGSQVETFLEAGRTVAEGGDKTTVLQRLARAAADGLGVAGATIYEYDPTAEALVCRACHPGDAAIAACGTPGEAVPLDGRPRLREILDATGAVVDRAGDPDLDDARREMLTDAGAEVCVAAPARLRGAPVGLLHLCETDRARYFDADELALVEGLATQIALALRPD